MEELYQVEANIDDMNPQVLEYAFQRLLDLGARDVWAIPMMMKKNRLATMVCVLCAKGDLDGVSTVLFEETTTVGVRYFPVGRTICERTIEVVHVEGKDIHCKISSHNGKITNISAEYDDCRRAAVESGIPIKEWQRRAKEEAYNIYGSPIETTHR